MILATKKNNSRDGELLLVSQDRTYATSAKEIATSLQQALDHWQQVEPQLKQLQIMLNENKIQKTIRFDPQDCMAPLPRAYAWLDGSAFLNHVILVRKARGAELPSTLRTDPLMYQGCSDSFIGPSDPILIASEEWGIDFESEICVITDDVPMGVSNKQAATHIRLITICNDISLRNLIPEELSKGFGFLNSKPTSSFAPLALTPDELGNYWQDSRLHLPLNSYINNTLFGNPHAGSEMFFSFADLIHHAAKTRRLSAGTIIGSGTVSNEDRSRGSSCIVEKRMLEKINSGTMTSPFLKFGDEIRIEVLHNGISLFGAIQQKVEKYFSPG